MKHFWKAFVLVLVLAMSADAQITQTATFENYAPNTNLGAAFTDSLSGISFLKPTHTAFTIDYDPYGDFNGTQYLTCGGGPTGFGGDFGFTGDLPHPSDQISIDIVYYNSNSNFNVTLEGFDSSNALISQQAYSTPGVFTLQVSSSEYNIASFQVVVDGGFEGYDNISYTYLPEPSICMTFLGIIALHRRRTRHR